MQSALPTRSVLQRTPTGRSEHPGKAEDSESASTDEVRKDDPPVNKTGSCINLITMYIFNVQKQIFHLRKFPWRIPHTDVYLFLSKDDSGEPPTS